MEADTIYRIASWLVPLVVAIVFHEVSHGWVAHAFGDPTAKQQGRLSLNPIRHVDPIGTVGLPLILALSGAPVFGWAKPVPVRANRMRNPRLHMMLVALAGPGMNFLLGFAAALGLLITSQFEAPQFLRDNLLNFLAINVFLAVFNLMPLPPFDGGHVVEGLLPRSAARIYRKLAPFGFPLVIFLLLILPMIAPQLNFVQRVVMPPFLLVMKLYAAIAGPL
jgi:Zn-dependent protease